MASPNDCQTHLVLRRSFVRAGCVTLQNRQLHGYKSGEAMRHHTASAHGGVETDQPCCVNLRRRMELAQKGEFRQPKTPRGISRH